MVKRYKFRPESFVIECDAKNRGGALGSTTRRKVWHFWTAFSFRGPRPPGNGLLIRASSPGTRCFRVAARTARFTCPEFYCILPVDSMTTRDLNTVGPCRLFASLFCFFVFLNSGKHVTLCFPLCIFTIPGDIILIGAVSFFLTNMILVIASLKWKEKKNNPGEYFLCEIPR